MLTSHLVHFLSHLQPGTLAMRLLTTMCMVLDPNIMALIENIQASSLHGNELAKIDDQLQQILQTNNLSLLDLFNRVAVRYDIKKNSA